MVACLDISDGVYLNVVGIVALASYRQREDKIIHGEIGRTYGFTHGELLQGYFVITRFNHGGGAAEVGAEACVVIDGDLYIGQGQGEGCSCQFFGLHGYFGHAGVVGSAHAGIGAIPICRMCHDGVGSRS